MRRVFVFGCDDGFPPLAVAYVLGLVGVAEPTVAVLGDGRAPVPSFGTARVVELTPGTEPGLPDVVVVDVDDPASALSRWHRQGTDELLTGLYGKGALVCARTNAAVCLFDSGVVPASDGGEPNFIRGLGVVPASLCPQHDQQDVARVYYELISHMVVPPGVGVDDGAGALFEDESLSEVVAVREDAHVYTLANIGGEVTLRGMWARRLDA